MLALVALSARLACATGMSRVPTQQFIAPAPGSYTLQVIQRAPGGRVLDTDGRSYDIRRYMTGRVTLLSFMYTYCVDPIGCPFAYATLTQLRQRVMDVSGDLGRQVRFVSLSFDPANDTPAVMKSYGGALGAETNPLRWHFLTTRSVADLKPIIDELGQPVAVQLDDQGKPTRLFNHMLKVFLLDQKGRVREIYSTAYLLSDVVFNDIQTLVLEQRRER